MNRIPRIFTAIFILLLAGQAIADGRLQGQVVSADTSVNLEGAEVRISSLNRSVATGPDGRFSLGNVPAGNYSVDVIYLGAPAASQQVTIQEGRTAEVVFELGQEMEEVLVRGARAGTTRALNIQRTADNVKSVVSADDIGQLPDANVAEAVQRVPGVFLVRDQGEGRYIGIRGIDPNLNLTTINGLMVPAPDAGERGVALDVIPSDLVETLEISKTFTPDMDAGAIGGTVNVRSLSAFDREALTLNAEASYNELVEKTSPKLSASWSSIFDAGKGADNFGVALAISWFDRDLGSDNIETDGGWPTLETVDGAEFKGAEEIEQRSYSINRKRLGVVANFDWRTDNGTFYWRNLYSHFTDQEYRTRNEWKFDDGDAVSGSDTSAAWEDATIAKSMKDRKEKQKILTTLIGGESYINTWTLDYSYGYSKSEESEPDRLDTEFEAEELDIGYTDIGKIPDLVGEEAAYEVASFLGKEFIYLDGDTDDKTNTFRFNATNDLFNESYNGDIKFGALYRTRDKDYDVDEFVYDAPDDLRLELFRAPPPRYDLGRFGPGISADAVRSFFFANQDDLELDEGDTLINSLASDYEMSEDVTAAFVMSTVNLGDWRLIYGVRYEHTDFKAKGIRILTDDVEGSGDPEPTPVDFDNKQDHWLPGINARWERDDYVFRAAATRTIARPNFGELSPGGEVEFEEDDGETELTAEIGNPLLDIVKSTNVDVAFEWYPGGASVLSAGVFYKHIKNFIFYADIADIIDLGDLIGEIPVDEAEVISPVNGDTADVWGLELSGIKQWDSGWYVNVNGTFVSTDARFPGREEKGDLPRTPDVVLNGAVGWENDKWSLRLAATYRDDALLSLEEIDDPDFDVYQDSSTHVDFSARWNFIEDWQLSFTANNLTDEPYYTYFGSRSYNAQYEEYGATYTLGLRWTPF